MGKYEDWKEQTKQVLRRIRPDRRQGGALNTVAEIAPHFGEVSRVTLMGGFYANPTVDLKTRSLCTIAALTVMVRQPLLKEWIINGINAGCTRDEIVEIISQMGFYGGIPAAVMAFSTAKEAFQEAGV